MENKAKTESYETPGAMVAPFVEELDYGGERLAFAVLPIGIHSTGDGYNTYVYKVSAVGDHEVQERDVAGLFPDVPCEHDYDCCGRWYPCAGRIVHRDVDRGYLLVEQDYIQNV